MKIAILGPSEIRTPPKGYGGAELINWYLIRRLVLLGHEVWIMVKPDSIVPCSQMHRAYSANGVGEWESSGWIPELFDVLHDKWGNHPVATMFSGLPFVTTEHGTSVPTGPQPCAISYAQAVKWEKPDIPVLYNGIDSDFYRYCENKDGFVLYLGSVQKIKGVADWVKAVSLSGLPGVVAGNRHEQHCAGYWENECAPILPKNVHVINHAVGGEEKINLFAKASVFLFLPRVIEAFGTVVIEALVSGTPVVTWDYGPMKEIVEHGVSGFVVPYGDHKAAAQALLDAKYLNPFACWVQGTKFSDTAMALNHLKVYKRVKGGERWQ